jgi:hypothetical protein
MYPVSEAGDQKIWCPLCRPDPHGVAYQKEIRTHKRPGAEDFFLF